ncbi:hypothetical protein [Escherichia coli]|uniref:hypothetical protein n=1 Tax=Escherichia coli TaxID=562 RepID=UPI0008FC0231|nr:hypothetical protein [Escherichia coli]
MNRKKNGYDGDRIHPREETGIPVARTDGDKGSIFLIAGRSGGKAECRAQIIGPGLAWLGLAWLGLAWLGLAWLGLAWLGLAWLGNIVMLGLIKRNNIHKKI